MFKKTKKMISVTMCIGILSSFSARADYDSISIYLNNNKLNCDSQAEIVNGRTMVPYRAICEALGAEVDWDGNTNTVTTLFGSENVSLKIGSNCMQTTGGTKLLDCLPFIKNGRTMVPLRAFCEAFGCNVSWDGNTGSVNVETQNNNTPNIENDNTPNIESNNTPNIENDNVSTPNTNNSISENNSSMQQQIFNLVNEERKKYGLAELKYATDLEAVAYSHSKDMADNNYFSHTSLLGLSPFDRIKNAGINYTAAAENIAAGQTGAKSVMESWMNSEGHRANILSENITEIGIGYYEGGSYGTYYTQVFVKRR